MANKYLIIDASILPDVFEKVVKVKELLATGKVKDISEGVKKSGISRSTYYKYKDFVFSVAEGVKSQKATIGLLLGHERGTLSNILDRIAESKGNILTINQDIPINNAANVTITFDISEMNIGLKDFLEEIESIKNVVRVNLIAME
ncbi:ACT domain-containing protein [Clostridium niameyense]|uniref:UPF0735 ACT domain-containing protein FDF74_00350 n=1 Tax=Clostridium niameyense TaxID=1622073 RepID=A0A6M0R681_9CLOT|nr:ACT domain-containing protein [Clostridium niameyense]NEZ45655.1 ACT domain-containing protein [Clostridium niameyense]